MAVGTYVVDNGVAPTTYFSTTGYTHCERGHFTTDVILKSFLMRPYSAGGTYTFKYVCYNDSTQARVYDSGNIQTTMTLNQTNEVVLPSPWTLTANTIYRIGLYTNIGFPVNGGYPVAAVSLFTATVNSSPSYTSWVYDYAGMYRNNGDVFPIGANSTYHHTFGWSVDQVNALPTAPTGLVVPDVSVAGVPSASWTHNDPDANPQAKYQLRYRPVIP